MAKNLVNLNINGTDYDQRPYVVCEADRVNPTKEVFIPDFTLVNGATIIVKFLNGFVPRTSYLRVNALEKVIFKNSVEPLMLSFIGQVIMELRYDTSLANNGGGWIVLNTNVLAQADWTATDTYSPQFIQHKPTIPTLPIWGEGLTYDSETNTLTGSTQYILPKATTDELGGIKSYKNNTVSVKADVSVTTSAVTRAGTGYCGVELDSDNKAFVYVPKASTTMLGLVKAAKVNTGTVTAYTNGTVAYGLEVDGNGKGFVKIPQISTYGAATATDLGLIKVGDGLDITEDGTLSSTSSYTLPTASSTTLGGVKVGDTLNISNDVLNVKDYKEVTKSGSPGGWHYPLHVNGLDADVSYNRKVNSGFSVYIANATTATYGDVTLRLGNAPDSTTGTKAQKGFLKIQGEGEYSGTIQGPSENALSGLSFYLPDAGGTFVTHTTRGTAVGSSTTPVYIASNGRATACTEVVATSATNASNVYINTSSASAYYPMTFVTSASAGNKKLYIDSSTTATTSSGTGIRYNPSAKTCYCSGGFYELSDEKLKNFGDDIEVDLDKLSKLSKKYFTWKDDESNTQHIGVSAQEVQTIYPEIVNVIDEEGHLSVSYDKLSVVALKGIDVLNDKIKSLEERLERLEKLIEG